MGNVWRCHEHMWTRELIKQKGGSYIIVTQIAWHHSRYSRVEETMCDAGLQMAGKRSGQKHTN